MHSSLLTLCVLAEDDSPATDRLLRSSGFEIEERIEVRPPETATTRCPFVTLEWSRRWPAEEIWRARRR